MRRSNTRIGALLGLLNQRGFARELRSRAPTESACVAVTKRLHWFDYPIADRHGRRLWVEVNRMQSAFERMRR